MTATVTLEQARMLDGLGWERGQTHHRWYWWAPGVFEHLTEPELSCPGAFGSGVWYGGTDPDAERHEVEWCDSPSPTEALLFLEREHGWTFGRSTVDGDHIWYAWHGTDNSGPKADTPEELLTLILAARPAQSAEPEVQG